MLRTQIYLPEELRKEIDNHRAQTGESLSDYLRKAASERAKKHREKTVDLKKLASDIAGSSKRSSSEAEKWIKEIRDDRRLLDERLERRWQEAKRGN
jgi:negative regulator of replication initiation